jgi:hypothetical protein
LVQIDPDYGKLSQYLSSEEELGSVSVTEVQTNHSSQLDRHASAELEELHGDFNLQGN